jgi:TonB-linked SusC/RagA family outer membrane protein
MMIKKKNMTTRAHKLISLLKHLRFIVLIGAMAYSNIAISQTDTITIPAKEYVTGIVRDAVTKEPVAAAQIKTLSNSAAATTNEKGYFNIEIISTTDILLVIAIDYNAIELPIKGRNNLNIELYRDVFSLFYNEYENISGLKRASFNTNSASKIENSDDPSWVAVDNILQSNMGGDIRGISRSGLSGIGSSLFIRGLNSINLNAQPLFVVDGVLWNSFSDINSLHDGFYNNPLTDIDPNDIESITVVKDGTSLYGSKGGNGVILIKTKRGVDVSTKIMINMSAGVNQSPSSYPLMNGDQFRLYSTDMFSSMGYSPQSINSMPFLMADTSSASYKTFNNATGWEDEIYKRSTFQSYNISVNGGDEKALYAFSMGYTGNKGNINNTDMQRLNTRFNADFFLTDKIDMGLNIGFTNIDRNLLDDGVNFYTSPTYLAMIKSEFLSPYSYTNSGTLTGDFEDSDIFGVGNPVAVIENSLNYNKHYRLNMGLKPKIQITPEFSISNQFDYSLFKVKEAHYDPIVGTAEKYIEGYGISQNLFQNQIIRNNNFFNDFRLMYNPKYGQNHRINSIAGIRYLSDSFTSDYAEGHNSGSDQKRNLQTEEEFKYLNGTNKNINSLSYYANVDYSFNNRYMVTAAISVDGSSRFGRETENGFQLFDHSWGVFPSINAAWLASSEPFMANIPYIDLLKVRAGYGITGNDDIEPYAYSAYFSPIRFMNRANGLYLSNIGNSQIQWETTSKTMRGWLLISMLSLWVTTP